MMPLQRYTVLFTRPPSTGNELILEDREDPYDEPETHENDVELHAGDAELLRIRGGGNGGELPLEAAALVKAVADKARVSSAASVNRRYEAIPKKPAAAAPSATRQPAHLDVLPSRNVAPRLAKPVVTTTENAMTAVNTKRKRPTNVCISHKSPLFDSVLEVRKQHEFNIDVNILETCHDQWLKSALINIIRTGTTIFKVEHTICPPKPLPVHNRPIRKHNNSRKTKRRSFPYFRSDHHKAIWLQNKNGAQEVNNILNNLAFYPLYVTFQRWAHPTNGKQPAKTDASNPPPAKRLKIDSSVNATPQPRNDVICLLDSSDDEDEPDLPAKNDNLESTTRSPDTLPIQFTTSYEPPADPTPPLLKASDNADFVLTPYGAGKIVASRVERYTSTSGNASILKPTIIFSIDLHFGICHVPSHQVTTISGTPYVSKPLLTYNKVPITAMDLLRLRPMTYLNDSIVNFYLKYLKAQTETVNTTAASGRGWDDLDGNGVYIFPSFCYNQIMSIMSLGNDNKNTKANRQKIWKELKTWTKGTDIFKKRMLIFPINYKLHWTVLIVLHPGRLIRRYEKVDSTDKSPASTPKPSPNPADNDIATKTPEQRANGYSEVFSEGVSVVKQFITNIANQISSPSRKRNGQATSETVSNSEPGTEKSADPIATKWECDFCVESFATYEEASQHEKKCLQHREFCMLHFDSGKHFKLHDSQAIAGNVRKYLSAFYDSEYATTHPNVGPLTQTNLPAYTSAVPQQDNTRDCGVYMLEIVERLIANPPTVDHEFVKNKCKVFAKDLFTKNVIEQKRDDILQLALSLREKQGGS